MSKVNVINSFTSKIIRAFNYNTRLSGPLLSQRLTRNMSSTASETNYPNDFLDFVNASPSRKPVIQETYLISLRLIMS